MSPMNPRLLRPSGKRLLLDLYGSAAAAYSLRRLRSSYTGPVVQVRRSSDNAEASFTAAEVASGALTSWIGAGNSGLVKTWYDQTGNARDASQSTSANQPQISTDVTRFGSGSIAFNGSSSVFSVASSALFGFGTGDFTVDYWVYPLLTGVSNQVVVDGRNSDTNQPWLIGMTVAGAIRYYDGATVRTAGTMNANTWHHVAWSRQSGVNRIFLNGSQVSTYTASQDFGSARGLTIGGNVLAPFERATCYIEGLRLTKGVALFVSAFTTPTF